jgi:hypothetical protein
MTGESTPLVALAGDECGALRELVLRLGALLGWSPSDVIAFAEAVTGCPWPRAGRPELERVMDEYGTLLRVLQAKQARRATRAPADGHALGT